MENPNLTNNKELIGQLLKATSDPIAIISKSMIILYANKAFNKLFESEAVGKNLKDILRISPSIAAISQNYFSEVIKSIVKIFPIEIKGTLQGFTVRIEYNEKEDYDKEKKFSFRAAAHDLNNIFTNILNSIDLLKNASENFSHNNKLLNIVENNSKRAADILYSVMSKKRPEKSYKSKIEFNSLLEEITNSFKLFLPNRIKFETNIQFGLPQVMGNHTDLYRSLYNLLINAKEAIRGEGTISLSATQKVPFNNSDSDASQKMLSIKIGDTGIGIPEVDLDKIFHGNFSTKKSDKVSGIGLNNVKNILTSHNGQIKVTSEVNKGTTFELLLPIIESNQTQYVEEFKRILIAEDEDTLRELLKDLFESHEFNVTAVSDGNEVLETIKKDPFFDLLIIDKKMPNLDGLESIKEIRKMKLKMPIILATGSTSEDLKNLENQFEISLAIRKPYKFDDLLQLVKKHL